MLPQLVGCSMARDSMTHLSSGELPACWMKGTLGSLTCRLCYANQLFSPQPGKGPTPCHTFQLSLWPPGLASLCIYCLTIQVSQLCKGGFRSCADEVTGTQRDAGILPVTPCPLIRASTGMGPFLQLSARMSLDISKNFTFAHLSCFLFPSFPSSLHSRWLCLMELWGPMMLGGQLFVNLNPWGRWERATLSEG